MYISNNRISARQVMRLLTFDLLGYSALMIPAVLAKEAGRDGIFSLLLGTVAAFLYLRLLKRVISGMSGSYSAYLSQTCGGFWSGIFKICYLSYFFLLAGNVAVVFAELAEAELLENHFHLILILLLLLTFYGAVGGIEGRARVYEILFWIVLLPLLLMMLSTLPTVDTDYWSPVFSAAKSGVLKGAYRTFGSFSILFLLPFLSEHVRKKERLYTCGKHALLLTAVLLCLLYLILLGMFGSKALAATLYPAVTMMSRVQITGGFLKRVDALMFGIWFFTLFALLNSLVFFGAKVLADFLKPAAAVLAKKLQAEMEKERLETAKPSKGGLDCGDSEANEADKCAETAERTVYEDAAACLKTAANGNFGTEKEKLEDTVGKGLARICLIAGVLLVFCLAEGFHQSETARIACEQLLWYAGIPFLVFVPFLLCLLEACKKRA